MIRFAAIALLALLSFPASGQEVPGKKHEVPFRADSGLIAAEYYLATGKYAQALEVLGGVLNRHPQNADAYAYRGYAYGRLGETAKARENHAKALAIDPTHLGANKYMADIYLEEGDLPRALEQMQVIRMICGHAACEEQDELEAGINRYKASKAER